MECVSKGIDVERVDGNRSLEENGETSNQNTDLDNIEVDVKYCGDMRARMECNKPTLTHSAISCLIGGLDLRTRSNEECNVNCRSNNEGFPTGDELYYKKSRSNEECSTIPRSIDRRSVITKSYRVHRSLNRSFESSPCSETRSFKECDTQLESTLGQFRSDTVENNDNRIQTHESIEESVQMSICKGMEEIRSVRDTTETKRNDNYDNQLTGEKFCRSKKSDCEKRDKVDFLIRGELDMEEKIDDETNSLLLGKETTLSECKRNEVLINNRLCSEGQKDSYSEFDDDANSV